ERGRKQDGGESERSCHRLLLRTDTVCPPKRAFAHAIHGDRARPLALSSAGPRPAARASVHIRLAPTVSGSRPEPSAVHPTWCGTVESAASLEPTRFGVNVAEACQWLGTLSVATAPIHGL